MREFWKKRSEKPDSDKELKPKSVLPIPFNFVCPSNLEKRRDKHTVVRKGDFAAYNRIGRGRLIRKHTDSAAANVHRHASQQQLGLLGRCPRGQNEPYYLSRPREPPEISLLFDIDHGYVAQINFILILRRDGQFRKRANSSQSSSQRGCLIGSELCRNRFSYDPRPGGDSHLEHNHA